MTITQFGRVEFDPMRVPVPTRATTKDIPSFDMKYQSEITQGERFKAAPPNEVDERPPEAVPNQPTANHQEARSSQVQRGSDHSGSVGTAVAGSTAKNLPSEGREPGPETTTHGGASARRSNAGKGVGAPAISSGDATGQGQAKALRSQADSSEMLSPSAVINSTQQGQSNTGPNIIQSDGLALKDIGAKTRAQVNSPFAGYKTVNKYSLRFAEAARESVFKQIAIRLKADGGDMLLRLDPPELGKLDLRMQIENHNQMRLVIRVERPEMLAMLEKHMAELEQDLQRQGIIIIGTEVRQFDQQGASEAQNNFRQGLQDELGGDANEEENTTIKQLDMIRPGVGFITADSLDFWA